MTLGELMDDLFALATGVVGWTPEVVLTTPIPQLAMAIEKRIDFAVKTNPFGDA